MAYSIVVIVDGQGDLLEVVLALGPGGGFPDPLDCRQEQPDQHSNYGDYDQ
jgi:hypothetical protein